jgi:hypothetical protein
MAFFKGSIGALPRTRQAAMGSRVGVVERTHSSSDKVTYLCEPGKSLNRDVNGEVFRKQVAQSGSPYKNERKSPQSDQQLTTVTASRRVASGGVWSQNGRVAMDPWRGHTHQSRGAWTLGARGGELLAE